MGLFRNSETDAEKPSRRSSTSGSRRRGFLPGRMSSQDPTISVAREKVALAEKAEKEADKALLSAKKAVKAARDHVRVLEKEAAQE